MLQNDMVVDNVSCIVVCCEVMSCDMMSSEMMCCGVELSGV
jgi:hypothetical protein